MVYSSIWRTGVSVYAKCHGRIWRTWLGVSVDISGI